MENVVLRFQVYHPFRLRRCGWLWVGNNLCSLLGYLYLLDPYITTCLCGWNPSANIDFFYICVKISVEAPKQNKSCRPKTLIGFVGQLLIKMETLFVRGILQMLLWRPLSSNLCKHASGHSLITEARTLQEAVWYGGLEDHWSYLRCVFSAWHLSTNSQATYHRISSFFIQIQPRNRDQKSQLIAPIMLECSELSLPETNR